MCWLLCNHSIPPIGRGNTVTGAKSWGPLWRQNTESWCGSENNNICWVSTTMNISYLLGLGGYSQNCCSSTPTRTSKPPQEWDTWFLLLWSNSRCWRYMIDLSNVISRYCLGSEQKGRILILNLTHQVVRLWKSNLLKLSLWETVFLKVFLTWLKFNNNVDEVFNNI